LQNDPRIVTHEAGAFGEAFASLMTRLTGEFEGLAEMVADRDELARIRGVVALRFEHEAERLIARHRLPEGLAEYVRHVVREGFDVGFDPMDPSEAALADHAGQRDETGWTASAPALPGAYALRQPGPAGPVEMARFEALEDTWLVHRWGLTGAVRWSELEGRGWCRWAAPTPLPPP
jgi:hypothetical protein